MIAIINYGVGNLFSLSSSFAAINQNVEIISNPNDLKNFDRIILPGVGAFGDAAEKLFSSGMAEPLFEEAKNGKPILGICVGMQLLFTKSYEFGEHDGLNLIPGSVRAIKEVIPDNLKIPQIGWNALHIVQPPRHEWLSPPSQVGADLVSHLEGRCHGMTERSIFKNTNEGEYVYFVHSYSAFCDEKFVTSTTNYGADLVASVQSKNIYGVQFHPEKSGNVGLNILRAFCEV